MPLLLALNSSGDLFSAALGDTSAPPAGAPASRGHSSNTPPAQPTCRIQPQPQASQSATALPLIKALLADCSATLRQVDAFAFAAGPGKFSALRLACATAASFAYAGQKPLVAVPNFCALAQANYGNDQQDLTVKCALPAHRDHIYYAVCRRSNGAWRISRAALRRQSAKASAPDRAIKHACGAACDFAPALMANAAIATLAPHPTAAAVWRIAAVMLASNDTTHPLACQPIYLRHKVAHTIKERQHLAKQRQCAQTS